MKKIRCVEDIYRMYGGDTVQVDLTIPDIIPLLMKEAKIVGCNLIMIKHGIFFLKDYKAKQRHKLFNKLIL